MHNIHLLISITLTVLSIPGLYLGTYLVATFGLPFMFFIAPTMACLAVAGYFLWKAEKALVQEFSR